MSRSFHLQLVHADALPLATQKVCIAHHLNMRGCHKKFLLMQKPISRNWLAAGQRRANFHSPDGFYAPMNLNRFARWSIRYACGPVMSLSWSSHA